MKWGGNIFGLMYSNFHAVVLLVPFIGIILWRGLRDNFLLVSSTESNRSGDHDMCVPYTGSEAWTKAMGYKIEDQWRPWFLGRQVAGWVASIWNSGCPLEFMYFRLAGWLTDWLTGLVVWLGLAGGLICRFTQGYANKLTFATIKVRLLVV